MLRGDCGCFCNRWVLQLFVFLLPYVILCDVQKTARHPQQVEVHPGADAAAREDEPETATGQPGEVHWFVRSLSLSHSFSLISLSLCLSLSLSLFLILAAIEHVLFQLPRTVFFWPPMWLLVDWTSRESSTSFTTTCPTRLRYFVQV